MNYRANIIQCRRCDGRGWVHCLHPTPRGGLLAQAVIPLRVARKWALKVMCPACHGSRIGLRDPQNRRIMRSR